MVGLPLGLSYGKFEGEEDGDFTGALDGLSYGAFVTGILVGEVDGAKVPRT